MQRHARSALGVLAPVLLICLLLDHPSSRGVAAVLVASFPVLLVAAAVAGRPLLRLVLGALWLLLTGSWGALLWLERAGVAPPLGLYVMLFGLALAPLILVSWGYAATFVPGSGSRSADGREEASGTRGPGV